jgi:isoquinoline 1-oxidoreductase beta subunit
VADTWWRARTALDALPIVWDEGPNAKLSSADIAAMLKEGLDAPDAVVGNSNGDARAAIASAKRKVEAVYSYPFQNHATMEVMNATVKWTPERCEVWTPTQNGEAALAAASEASGLPPSKCDVYKLHLGGGFGRRGAVHDWVRQAVEIAKAMPGTPVKLIWSREEDMLHGRYHPVTQCKLTAGLDAKGEITGLHMRISGQSILASVAPQSIKDGKDPVVFQGLNAPGPEASIGYSFPQPADRPCHAQSARACGLLARREPEPEHHLPRMLHGRSGACHQAGPAGAAPQADGEQSQAPGRAERGGRKGGLGQASAQGRVPRPGANHGLR